MGILFRSEFYFSTHTPLSDNLHMPILWQRAEPAQSSVDAAMQVPRCAVHRPSILQGREERQSSSYRARHRPNMAEHSPLARQPAVRLQSA